jgi:hypothetical protein
VKEFVTNWLRAESVVVLWFGCEGRTMERAGSDLTAFAETVVFLDYFKDLPDPRQAGKVIYPLPEVLLLCLLAMGRRLPRKPPHRIIPSPDSPAGC